MKVGWRFWILIVILGLSVLAIGLNFQSGVIIQSVNPDSLAYEQGISPGEIIKEVNNKKINSLEDYTNSMNSLFPTNEEIRVDFLTDKSNYILFTNETPNIIVRDIPSTNIQTGLDIRGGSRALVEPEQKLTDTEFQDLIQVSQNRFNVFGISDVKIRSVTD